MAYDNFTLESVKHQFELNLFDAPFCESLPTANPQSEFLTIFQQWLPLAQRAKSEKAKSELLVSPILTEVKRLAEDKVQLFSGEEFNVNREIGLNGFCDFLLSKSTTAYIIEAPVIMLVEAKKLKLNHIHLASAKILVISINLGYPQGAPLHN